MTVTGTMNITINNLQKTYGDVTALDQLTLEVPSNTTFGVLGTNGAGKTTMFKLLVGLDRPDGGEIVFDGQPATEVGVDLRERIGYLPERVGFPPALTGREVLTFHARVRGLPRDGRIATTLETVGLTTDEGDRPVDGYSNGMRRRLGLAAALLARPRLLILDEPTAGLDPLGVAEFHRTVERVRDVHDATVLLSSHALEDIERLCGRAVIVHDGRVVTEGPVDAMMHGSRATVHLRLAERGCVDATVAALDTLEEAATVAVDRPATIIVRCAPTGLPALFATLDGVASLADARIETAGLNTTFHEAIVREGTA